MKSPEAFSEAERIKTAFSGFTHTCAHALETLEHLYEMVFPLAKNNLLRELNDITDELRAGAAQKLPSTEKLRKSVYSLPYNEIIYEDGGASVMEEAILRLERYERRESLEEDIALLKKLAASHDGSTGWYDTLSFLRKKLLVNLTLHKDPFISASQNMRIIHLLDKIILDLQA